MRDQRVLRTATGPEPGLDLVRANHEEARRFFQHAPFDEGAAQSFAGKTHQVLVKRYEAWQSQSGDKRKGAPPQSRKPKR